MLLKYVVPDHLKHKPDVLSVCSTSKMWVYIGTSLLIDIDVHFGYKFTGLDVVMPWTYRIERQHLQLKINNYVKYNDCTYLTSLRLCSRSSSITVITYPYTPPLLDQT